MSWQIRLSKKEFVNIIGENIGMILLLFGLTSVIGVYSCLAESTPSDLRNLRLLEEEVGRSNFLIIGREIKSNKNVGPQDIEFFLSFANLHWNEYAKEFNSRMLPDPSSISRKMEKKIVWPN